MPYRLLHRRGNLAQLPTLAQSEFGYTVDAKRLFLGTKDGNIEIAQTTGDMSDTTIAFAQAGTRANIVTGEKMSVVLGKLAKWYADLKAVAWSGSYNDLTDKPTAFAPGAHTHNAGDINAGLLAIARGGTNAGDAATARTNLEITPANIGAAPKSHAAATSEYGQASAANFGHAKATGVTPAPLGTAAVGTDNGLYARGDHVHLKPTPMDIGAATPEQLEQMGDDLTGRLLTDSATGSIATLRNVTVPGHPLSVQLEAHATQPGTGDPSPDNVRPIAGKSAVNVTRAGRNLWKPINITTTNGVIYSVGADGTVTLNGTSTASSNVIVELPVSLPAGVQYTLSANNPASIGTGVANSVDIQCRDEVNGQIPQSLLPLSNISAKVTFTSQTQEIRGLRISVSATGHTFTNFIIRPQLELGPTATPYTPYTGNSYAVALPEPVYGLPDAADEVDVSGGGVTRRTACKAFDGTEPWVQNNVMFEVVASQIGITDFPRSQSATCSHFKPGNPGQSDLVAWHGNASFAVMRYDAKSTLSDWKSYLAAQHSAGTPVQVLYELATPTSTSIPPTTIPALAGDNNVWSDAGGDVTAGYDLGAYIMNHGNHVPATATANDAIYLRNDNSWQTITAAKVGAAATSHGNHVPTTQTASNSVFLRNDNSWQSVTAVNIGAASSSHNHNASNINDGTLPVTRGGTGESRDNGRYMWATSNTNPEDSNTNTEPYFVAKSGFGGASAAYRHVMQWAYGSEITATANRFQLACDYTSGTPMMYYRTMINSAWNTARKIMSLPVTGGSVGVSEGGTGATTANGQSGAVANLFGNGLTTSNIGYILGLTTNGYTDTAGHMTMADFRTALLSGNMQDALTRIGIRRGTVAGGSCAANTFAKVADVTYSGYGNYFPIIHVTMNTATAAVVQNISLSIREITSGGFAIWAYNRSSAALTVGTILWTAMPPE